jgi:Uma2 family endonuclease
MVQVLQKLVTFAEFTDWKPDGGSYELHNGVIIEMSQPLGSHEDIIGFIARKITIEFDRLNLPYSIPKQALVKPPESESGYVPDILLLTPLRNLHKLNGRNDVFGQSVNIFLPPETVLITQRFSSLH